MIAMNMICDESYTIHSTTIQYSANLLKMKINKENRISPLSSSVALFQGKYAIQKTG